MRQFLTIACLGALAFSLSVVAFNIVGWSRCINKVLLHADEFVGEGQKAMKNLASASSESRDSSRAVTNALPDILRSTQGVLDQVKATTKQIGDRTTTSLNVADKAMGSLDGSLQAAQGAFKTADEQLQYVGPMLIATTRTAGDFDALLVNPELQGSLVEAHGSLINMRRFSGSMALAAEDLQPKLHGWLYPPKQGKIRRVLSLLPLAGDVAETVYYLRRMP